MSVGMGKLFKSGNVPPVEDFTVFISPGQQFILMPLAGGSKSSNIVTANVTGGNPPFDFLWTKESGDPITISNPTGQQTVFTANTTNGAIQEALFKCTVTDDASSEESDTIIVRAEQPV